MDERPPLAIDSNGLSAWIRPDPHVLSLLESWTPVIPAPVLYESLEGWTLLVQKAAQRKREDLVGAALERLTAFHLFSRDLQVLPYDAAAQAVFRRLSSGRGSRGRSDLRIAAICIAQDLPLLTRNTVDFEDLPGIDLRTW
jgi:predicted nucleic acid-binding protein